MGTGPRTLLLATLLMTSCLRAFGMTVSEAKSTPLGTLVEVSEKIVTAGTDQLNAPFFYIQDDTGGIRVRTTQTVHQGDRVTVLGTMGRATDNGTATQQCGEKEIVASEVTVTPGPFAMARPVGILNKQLGGGPFGPIEADGYPAQPGVYKSGFSPNQVSEDGLNNVGRYARAFGIVVYADDHNEFFYIDDGSYIIDGSTFSSPTEDPQTGVRVVVRTDERLTGVEGSVALVTGIVGSICQDELMPGTGVNNVRIIRPAPEPFTDSNGNGRWDAGEPYADTNGSGAYDGIVFLPLWGAEYTYTPPEVPLVVNLGWTYSELLGAPIEVTVTNTSKFVWTIADFKLGYHWFDRSGGSRGALIEHGVIMTHLPVDLDIGQSAALHASFSVPDIPQLIQGQVYYLTWDMKQLPDDWFMNHQAVPLDVLVRINQKPLLVPPTQDVSGNPLYIKADTFITARDGETLSFYITAYDPDGDEVTFFEMQNGPPGAVLTLLGSDSAMFSWTPTAADIGVLYGDVRISCKDPNNLESDPLPLPIKANGRPKITSPAEGQSWTIIELDDFAFNIYYEDVERDTPISFNIQMDPLATGPRIEDYGYYDDTHGQARFLWTPNTAQAGDYNLTIEISNAYGSSSSHYTVTVNDMWW